MMVEPKPIARQGLLLASLARIPFDFSNTTFKLWIPSSRSNFKPIMWCCGWKRDWNRDVNLCGPSGGFLPIINNFLVDFGCILRETAFQSASSQFALCVEASQSFLGVGFFVGWSLVLKPLTHIFLIPMVLEPLTNTFRIPMSSNRSSLYPFATFVCLLSTTCCWTCTAISRITARPAQSILIIATVWVVTIETNQMVERLSLNRSDADRCVTTRSALYLHTF